MTKEYINKYGKIFTNSGIILFRNIPYDHVHVYGHFLHQLLLFGLQLNEICLGLEHFNGHLHPDHPPIHSSLQASIQTATFAVAVDLKKNGMLK
jgi:hypothetical protein